MSLFGSSTLQAALRPSLGTKQAFHLYLSPLSFSKASSRTKRRTVFWNSQGNKKWLKLGRTSFLFLRLIHTQPSQVTQRALVGFYLFFSYTCLTRLVLPVLEQDECLLAACYFKLCSFSHSYGGSPQTSSSKQFVEHIELFLCIWLIFKGQTISISIREALSGTNDIDWSEKLNTSAVMGICASPPSCVEENWPLKLNWPFQCY